LEKGGRLREYERSSSRIQRKNKYRGQMIEEVGCGGRKKF